ncbi:N-acetylglucosaminyl deacetylase, LmbE family [Raineyella antarctica]|uniref:N-acetylglucosaminyl deacetylase, LmbE family n=1 Tax=Raineyella antarctica TaxID=1577474 RepID=A0A1G6H3J4_9ACTN|nr:PIG-L family deacetylase [Raineyella antarctica]SDB88877.1 N-acetylglucosaminyl deacetylase, LmbE family [Raineyella antarctica]
MTRTFALVVAHPDDDALTWAGTVAKHADEADFRFVLVQATDGEAGDIREGFPATRETLGAIRRDECAAAWRAVGRPPDRLEWLGLPDGRVAEVPLTGAVERIGAVLETEAPDVVATFGPDGITGHPDHIAVGLATDIAFAQLAAAEGPGFRRLLHHVLPQSVFERWQRKRQASNLPVFDPTRVYHWRGVPDCEVGLVVNCRGVRDRVLAGILEHRSQLHVIADQPIDVLHMQRTVGREWAVVAWPPTEPPCRLLTDVFDGL